MTLIILSSMMKRLSMEVGNISWKKSQTKIHMPLINTATTTRVVLAQTEGCSYLDVAHCSCSKANLSNALVLFEIKVLLWFQHKTLSGFENKIWVLFNDRTLPV